MKRIDFFPIIEYNEKMTDNTNKEVVFFIPAGKNYPYEEVYNFVFKQFKEKPRHSYDNIERDCNNIWIYAKTDEEFTVKFKNLCIVNNSVKYNDTVCPLLLDVPPDPVILNLNGRVYSEKMILKAIETTICQCKPLNLGDITIKIRDYAKIRIYRFNDDKNQYSGYPIGLPPVKKYPAPDVTKSKLNHNYFTSEYLLDVLRLREPIMIDKLTEDLNKQHETVKNRVKLYDESRYEMSDFMMDNKKIAGGHSKAPLDIINVHFTNCRFINECYCGQHFISCTFERCVISEFERAHVVGCDFKKCLFEKSTRNKDAPLIAIDFTSANFNDERNIDNRLVDCKTVEVFHCE